METAAVDRVDEELHNPANADLFLGAEVLKPAGEAVGALNLSSPNSWYAMGSIVRLELYPQSTSTETGSFPGVTQ